MPPNGPFLFARSADWDALSQRVRSDATAAWIFDFVLEVASDAAQQPLPRYEIIGPRLLFTSREVLGRIGNLGMAWRLTREERFAEAAARCLDAVAAFPDWNPSHFLDVAEMALAVAIGCDWLQEYADGSRLASWKQALIDHALAPGLSEEPFTWYRNSTHNWNQVCHGGLAAAASQVEDLAPELAARLWDQIEVQVPLAMEAYAPDGAFPEGPVYWDYATDYTILLIEVLRSVGRDASYIRDALGLLPSARYRMHTTTPMYGRFNYADCQYASSPATALFWFGRELDHSPSVDFAQSLLERKRLGKVPLAPGFNSEWAQVQRPELTRAMGLRFLPFSLLWNRSLESDAPEPTEACFDGSVPIATWRSAWGDERASYFAIKGGDNQANHGHLDLGSFVFESRGVRWALDLGTEDYNLPDFFDRRPGGVRWTYYRTNSRSHNVPTFEDALQDAEAKGSLIARAEGPLEVEVDLSEAYVGFARDYQRCVQPQPDEHWQVTDRFVVDRSLPRYVWQFVTEADVEIEGQSFHLQCRGETLVVPIVANFPIQLRVAENSPPTAREHPNIETSRCQVVATELPPGTWEISATF